MTETPLFERLGGRDGIRAVVEKSLANHYANPRIKTRFEHAQQTSDELVEHAVEFFCTGLSGVETYRGRSLPDAHAGRCHHCDCAPSMICWMSTSIALVRAASSVWRSGEYSPRPVTLCDSQRISFLPTSMISTETTIVTWC